MNNNRFPRGGPGVRGDTREEMRESDLNHHRAWRHADLAAGSAAAKPLEHRPASVRAERGNCRAADADFGIRHPSPGKFRRGCLANALYEAARSSKNDAVQAEINLGNDQISTVTQYSALASAQSDLATWIAHNGAEDLIAVEPAELEGDPLTAPTLENSLQLARDNRPLLKALSSQVRAADLGVSVARAGYWPSLQAQLSYLRQGNTGNPFFTDRHLNNSFAMGLALRWNLFSGMATDAQVRGAMYNRSTAQLNLEQSTHDVEADVRRTLRSLESSLRATRFARANLRAANYGSTLAQDRFKAGAGSTLEVRDAQLKLAQAELTLIQNRVNVEVARANLERAIGTYLKAY